MNAYELVEEVRNNIGEQDPSHWTNKEILSKLNLAQKRIANNLSMIPGDWLTTSAAVTPSSSIITLPTDCAKPLYLEETSSKQHVMIMNSVKEKGQQSAFPSGISNDRITGSNELFAYLQRNTLVFNITSYSTACTLYYQQRLPELHFGKAGTGSTTNSLVFDIDSNPKRSDDYYNDVTIEIVSGTGEGVSSTISDYVGSTYTATISGACAVHDTFGTVSLLPDEAMDLLILEASLFCLAKPSSIIDSKVFEFLGGELSLARRVFEEWANSRLPEYGYTRRAEL